MTNFDLLVVHRVPQVCRPPSVGRFGKRPFACGISLESWVAPGNFVARPFPVRRSNPTSRKSFMIRCTFRSSNPVRSISSRVVVDSCDETISHTLIQYPVRLCRLRANQFRCQCGRRGSERSGQSGLSGWSGNHAQPGNPAMRKGV